MKINKSSYSDKSQSDSSTSKSGCGCVKKGSSKEVNEEIDIKIDK